MTDDQMTSLNDPDKFLNVYLPDGEWVGFFYQRAFAIDYLRKNGYNPDECEISKRRPKRGSVR